MQQSQEAQVEYLHGKLRILGPSQLQTTIDNLAYLRKLAKSDEEDAVLAAQQAATMAQYHVVCAVTGERIALSDLKYWNVSRQIPYIRPEIIPMDDFYPHLVVGSP